VSYFVEEAQISDEEFYAKCSKNLEELYSFPISLQEKRNLHFLIYETIEQHIELKRTSQETKESMHKLTEGLNQIGNSFYSIFENAELIKKELGGICESGKIILINNQINAENMKNITQSINETTKGIKEVRKKIIALKKENEELDKKNTALEIIQNMTNQNKNK
jgi:hypothetical protein